MRLVHPIPLGWLQLWHRKGRFFVALAGIAFAVMLILMQLGFRASLFQSAVRYHNRLRYDVAIFAQESQYIVAPATFSNRRLYQARRAELSAWAKRLGWSYTVNHTDRLASEALISVHFALTGEAAFKRGAA